MNLKDALSVLSKSSPYAVATERSATVADELDKIKSYLYIKTNIEEDFESLILPLKDTEQKIIFLCGSSGDGKSEILTRYSQKAEYSHIQFHLDATHSFNPKLDAIATLDQLFTHYKATNKPLVVGINLGMMANYAQEGATEHDDIKSAMQRHTAEGQNSEEITFLSFEDHKYSKFSFKHGKPHSEFANRFMKKLTQQPSADDPNPIWELVLESEASNQNLKIVANYKLMAIESVQQTIVEMLMKARLAKDQFLTARSLLDFIHVLLVGDDYLFDNLFLSKNNELSERIMSFDPALIRTKNLDKFTLSLNLNLGDEKLSEFITCIDQFGIKELEVPASYIRLFYVLRDAELGNNYHLQFSSDFKNKLLTEYANILVAHRSYQNEKNESEKNVLSDFYKHTLFTALWRYINRSAPQLKNKQFLIANENEMLFSTELKLLIDWQLISQYHSSDLMAFKALMKVNGKTIYPPLPVNINLYELLQRLNLGYRPNKYDKSCVLLLDELVEKIKIEMSKTDALIIIDGSKTYEAEIDGGLIEITGDN